MARGGHALLPEPWDKLTLQSLAVQAALEHPARVFLRDCPLREAWNDTEPRALNSETFLSSARFLAAQLRTLGVSAGERVLILLPNMAEAALSILACHIAGATPAIAPIDEKSDMLRAAAERCEAVMILTTGRVGDLAIGEKARQIAAKVMHIRCVAGFGFNLPDGIVSLEGWAEEDTLPFTEAERAQSMEGLITFARENGTVVAALRSEGQMIAEALALTSVMRLDGRRGLISLMHPGASASVAASLILPLYANASVRLIGPYSTDALVKALAAEPTAFLYCPDHFAAQLAKESLGNGVLRNHTGILALTRIADFSTATIAAPGAYDASLLANLDERANIPLLKWPADGTLSLPVRYPHPMEGVLPDGQVMLEHSAEAESLAGFGAAALLRRAENGTKGKAA